MALLHFIGGPWDGLTARLLDGDFDELIIRITRYFPSDPHEFVYRRIDDRTFQLMPESDIIRDNARLREQAKQGEATINRLIHEQKKRNQKKRK
jgi:hypothetical protein